MGGRSEKTGERWGGGGGRRERGVREKDGEKKSSGAHNRGQCGAVYVYPPSPPLFHGQKVICQLIHAYSAWLFAMNTHGGGKGEVAPFNAVALR